MKWLFLMLAFFACINKLTAQNVGIGTTNPVEKLDVNGGIKIGATNNPAKGTIRWNEQRSDFEGYNGTTWVSLTGGTSGWGNQLSYSTENSATQFNLGVTPTMNGTELGYSIDATGDWMVAGAYRDNDYSYPDRWHMGSARVFRRNGDRWDYRFTIPDPDHKTNDHFGRSVAISATHIVSAAPYGDVGLALEQGKVHVYAYNNDAVNLQATLTSGDGATNDWFGNSVDISGDIIVAGAPGKAVTGIDNMGRVYIFKQVNNVWSQITSLTPPDGAVGDQFGHQVEVEGDLIAVTAMSKTVGPNSYAGKVYVYRKNVVFGWDLIAQLTSPEPIGRERFGSGLHIQNNRLAVGARHSNGSTDDGNGRVYMYNISGADVSYAGKLEAPDGQQGDAFGHSVKMMDDIVLVGANAATVQASGQQGKVYAFRWDGQSATHLATLTASTGEANIRFGTSLALVPGFAIVGAPFADLGTRQDNGQVFFFKR